MKFSFVMVGLLELEGTVRHDSHLNTTRIVAAVMLRLTNLPPEPMSGSLCTNWRLRLAMHEVEII